MPKKLSYEYIRGLVEGEGCFTLHTIGPSNQKRKIAAFVIGMSARDKDLLISVRDTLGLRNKVYEYKPRIRSDGYKRLGMAILCVRDIGQIKNIIVPFFYKRLHGNKGIQFEKWLEDIGSDPLVSNGHKFIHKIYKAGFYDRNPKYV